ncbi:MAG: hypothetical protein Tsb0013_12940 [Phycisphaerales bacterium]
MSTLGLLIAQVVASGMMCGLIWFVQVVHYPLFGAVPAEGFNAYAARHRARTTVVVAPLMFAELGCAIALVLAIGSTLAWIGLALAAGTWGVTFFVSVPLHMRLDRGLDGAVHRALVATNWIRTALWSARLWLSIAMLLAFVSAAGPGPRS